MKNYVVHVYAEVRIPINLVADDEIEAIKKAEDGWFEKGIEYKDIMYKDIEYTGDINGYIVDELNEDENINSKSYDSEYNEIKPFVTEHPKTLLEVFSNDQNIL